ncbi:peptidase S8 [bacterium (Candidatus Blackallbacteria) CG17_big_fil_post_rev_8_21_14_2_50_48_46]|uniref:Peptidase S8 n=1 Tax=bacterium (Candidatus Blackallbacteria) CG17_big_fil_post_rev_8_21_14_2_50_48_46 TaxID=2014261 RepID=A0A2M7G4Y1_9BACT|nr:MAG: peptidase S8 [bacterium (Candidatus Blackallbacteria) CG18_big_fil_WC_8_21_14_2_50_49_26]PIW16841.1 MAG: peptidase S8 [bacterium (Candidatus Blackallbacteria) CG17_big_fil_post_rev_8_21_14_2_50_48_46]PIW48038.1 MAG: peptidase S8 [bacterium (Candidatus Blackallbacteria) CG13_big_fil_rev_8_21_14_2_50_49_14]
MTMKKQLMQNFKKTMTAALAGISLVACGRMAPELTLSAPSNTLPTAAVSRLNRASAARAQYVPGQVIVSFKTRTHPTLLQQFAQAHGLRLLKVSPMGEALYQQLNPAMATAQVMNSLKQDPYVQYAGPNPVYTNKFTVNDPRSSEQKGLGIIGMGKAWDLSLGDPRVIIAVIDSGADLSHPDLRANLVSGYNVLSQGQTPPQDDNGHGTHASGIAAAVGDNREGVSGTCPRCKLMPVKALDAEGAGNAFDVAIGIVWAVDHGAQVINMSLGGPQSDPTLERAVRYAFSRNVPVVVAAGNESTNELRYPAAIPGVISVGAVDNSRQLAGFSNFGSWVSVVAPGVQILSTMPQTSVYMTQNEGYQTQYDFMDGTSMAAPIVAGLVGLIRSRHPQLTPAQIKTRLEGTAIDLGAPGFDEQFGNGMIDGPRALL